MDTVLVTGGAGYVGSHTCKQLWVDGYQPVVYDNLTEGHSDFVKWGELIAGDIAQTDKLLAVMREYRPKAVIHFAASAYVGASMINPQAYYDNNVAGTLSLLSAMREAGCQKLVFSSTCAVYGAVETLPIRSDTRIQPISPYGRSKAMVEQILQDAAIGHELSSVCLRYFNAAGADPDGDIGERHQPETHLIPNAIAAALGNKKALNIYGDDYSTRDGTCIRDYVHVSDLARGHVSALDFIEEKPGKHAFNLGAGVGTSILEVINEIENQLGVSVPVCYEPRRPGDPAELTADISHSKAILGWEPRLSDLPTIIRTALHWARLEGKQIGRTYK
jgi:UDP-arabinose 4-epimerase